MLEKALEFLKTHNDVAFATVEGDRPKIRVFRIMLQEGTVLYFATSPRKEVYRQLQADPYVELLAMEGDISVRVTGKVSFDVPDDTARRIYAGNEVLQRLYDSYASMVYFRLEISSLDYYDLTPDPPLLEHWTSEA